MVKKKKELKVEVIHEGFVLKKTDNTAIIGAVKSFSGADPVLDLREHYRTKGDKEWKPTGKGFTLPLGSFKTLRKKLLSLSKELGD